jgi:hypothetical protein
MTSNIVFAVGAERMRITGAGTVGIGTTDPKATLHVNGTITSRIASVTVSAAGNTNIFGGVNNYAGTNCIVLITAICTNSTINTPYTITCTAFVSWNSVIPSLATVFNQTSTVGTSNVQLSGSSYDVVLSTSSTTYNGTYQVNIMRLL